MPSVSRNRSIRMQKCKTVLIALKKNASKMYLRNSASGLASRLPGPYRTFTTKKEKNHVNSRFYQFGQIMCP